MEALTDRLPQNPITIDWAKPWYAPWRNIGEPVADALNRGIATWDARNAHADAPVRFTPGACAITAGRVCIPLRPS
ncbi:MAG: hypothetical protein ABIN37_12845 [Burkholderiaceae bacterium]